MVPSAAGEKLMPRGKPRSTIEAVCSDGKTATFQYGPIPSRNGKPWIGPVNPENYFIPWEKAAWEKLPVGVQLK